MMKWYTSLCIACALAFAVPNLASADPRNEKAHAEKQDKGAKKGDKVKADKDKADKADKDKADKPGKDKADKPGKDKADKPGKDKADKPGKDKADKPEIDKADKNEADKADKPEKDKADKAEKKGKRPDRVRAHKNGKKSDKEHKPVKDDEVKKIANRVKGHKGSAKRVAEALKSSEENAYTSAQVKELLDGMHNDYERMNLAISVYDDVVDKDNWDSVYGAFKASWCRQIVEDKLGLTADEAAADEAPAAADEAPAAADEAPAAADEAPAADEAAAE